MVAKRPSPQVCTSRATMISHGAPVRTCSRHDSLGATYEQLRTPEE
jgi:hypothetical protein